MNTEPMVLYRVALKGFLSDAVYTVDVRCDSWNIDGVVDDVARAFKANLEAYWEVEE